MQWDETSKSSPLNLISMNENQVHWTRFVYIETKFNELDFYVYKPSSMNSVSYFVHLSYWEIESSGLELLDWKFVWNVA